MPDRSVPAPIVIRPAQPADGAALVRAAVAIDAETEFLGVPGQPHPWAERPEAELRSLNDNERGIVLLALTGRGEIIGYLSAFLGHFARNRGTLFIAVVGLRATYRGQGIGTRLFDAVEDWARAHRAWRLELRVSSLNERGQALYRKQGLQVEGRIRAGVFRRGAWTDDLWMGKPLAPLPGAPLGAVSAGAARPPAGRRPIAALPTLREMRPGDGAAFQAWDKRMSQAMPYALKTPNEIPAAEAIERDIAHAGADPRYWLVATVARPRGGDAVVGFASATIEYGFRMQHDAFVNVAVEPEWQGQGVGRRLHDRVEAWAIDRGARRLTATVQAPNLSGRAFAAALGYETEVTMRGYSFIGGYMVDRLRLGKLFGG
ncbi:MAG TPA: GNAT family N-acetyltransferase [Stellaceae bacterium]|nr:GNAT family N-acetyltransferase [Stellaceae bacterium]